MTEEQGTSLTTLEQNLITKILRNMPPMPKIGDPWLGVDLPWLYAYRNSLAKQYPDLDPFRDPKKPLTVTVKQLQQQLALLGWTKWFERLGKWSTMGTKKKEELCFELMEKLTSVAMSGSAPEEAKSRALKAIQMCQHLEGTEVCTVENADEVQTMSSASPAPENGSTAALA